MKKFIPFEKMSKKEQREINNSRRNTWGNVNPGSKVIPNKKKEKEKLACRGGY